MRVPNQRLDGALETLSRAPGVLGALLVARDGVCVAQRTPSLRASESVSAMCSALVAASETALAELGDQGAASVAVLAPNVGILAAGVSDEFLLVTLFDPRVALAEIRGHHDTTAKDLRLLFAEGAP